MAAQEDEERPEGQKLYDFPIAREAAAMPPVWPGFDEPAETPEQAPAEQPAEERPADQPAAPRRVEVTPLGIGDPDELQRLYDNIRRTADAERAAAQKRAANKHKRKGKRKKRR